jgi:serine/threonine protein kinase
MIRNTALIDKWLRASLPELTKHLAPAELSYFQNVPLANRVISEFFYGNAKHVSKIGRGIPGMYFHRDTSFTHIFINLKKTPYIGKGSFGKVREVLWLNPPDGIPKIVVKKVFTGPSKDIPIDFEREISALKKFKNKRGIITPIVADYYDDKYVIFFPKYDCDLSRYLKEPHHPLSINEKLDVILQWLEALSTLSRKGTHGDIKPANLLLKWKEPGKVEAVIADLGSYTANNDYEYNAGTIAYAPPEYFANTEEISKGDIWRMGLSLFKMFAETFPPLINDGDLMRQWTSLLDPNWILEYRIKPDTPPFLLDLINDMTHPDPKDRPSAIEAFECFSKESAEFLSATPRAKRARL